MMKSCKYCGRVHDVGVTCKQKPKPIRHTDWGLYNGLAERKFRSTQAWRQTRDRVRERDHYLCRVCLDNKILMYSGIEVHHITSLKDNFDLRLEEDNLICLCREHHEKAEKGEIKRDYLRQLARSCDDK